MLGLAEQSDARDELVGGLARLWQSDALQIFVTSPLSSSERDLLFARTGGNRMLVAVESQDAECVSIASLTDRQVQFAIDGLLSDLTPVEREPWQRMMVETVQCLGDRVRALGVLTAVTWVWRAEGLQTAERGLQIRGWREDGFRWATLIFDLRRSTHSVPLTVALDVSVWQTAPSLAQALYEFGTRESGEPQRRLLTASVLLFPEECLSGRVASLIALGRSMEAESEESEVVWAEAVSLARKFQPEQPRLLVAALAGLGAAQQFSQQQDEAQQTVGEALSLAIETKQASDVIAELRSTLAYSLLDQERFAEALATAEQGLRDLGAGFPSDDVTSDSLLYVCDDACSHMGMIDRALDFAARRIEGRRRRVSLWWGDQTNFAERLLRLGAAERALAAITEVIDQLSVGDGELPYQGKARPLTVLADVHRASGEWEKAVSAMREAIRVYRAVIADDQSRRWMPDLAAALLSLSADLERLDRYEALEHLADAVDIVEQIVPDAQYPDDLAAALTRLGDYAAARKMYELATAAYARILVLAAPFPARTSEPVLEIERRLVALCEESGVPLDDALARGQRPVTVKT